MPIERGLYRGVGVLDAGLLLLHLGLRSAAPTLTDAMPPEIFARRSWSFSVS
jgi:hypothetical protein